MPDEDHSFKIQSRDRKVIYSDKNSEVYVKKSFGGFWDTTEVIKSTGAQVSKLRAVLVQGILMILSITP